jgi:hypothetical protein
MTKERRTLRERTGWRLRRLADRIDPANTPRHMGYSFTMESGRGIVFNAEGRGCPLWYLGEADNARAWSEAGTQWTRAPRPGDLFYVHVTARKREATDG